MRKSEDNVVSRAAATFSTKISSRQSDASVPVFADRHTRSVVTHYGGPDVLQVVEDERPEPKDGEVRLRVLAAGVSQPDLLAREGIHPETPRAPSRQGGIWLA